MNELLALTLFFAPMDLTATAPTTDTTPVPRTPAELLPECHPKLSKQCALDLARGQRAPFSGTLLTPDLALSLNATLTTQHKRHAAKIRELNARHDADLNRVKAIAAADARSWVRQRQAEREQYLAEIERLQPSWLDHPVVITGIVVAAAVATGVTVHYLTRD